MQNWQIITKEEHDYLWAFIYDKLQFSPRNKENPLLSFPMNHCCYDISMHYNEGFSEEVYEDLHKSSLECFKNISYGERLYALSWQHDCYSFSPEQPFEKDEFGEWLISIFPNGDYIFFLSKKLDNGIFADGINLSLCYFGDDIINCIQANRPLILHS